MEFSLRYGIDHFFSKHEILHILVWDDHTLISCQTFGLADFVESFDFFVHTTDGLDFTLLIQRSCDGDILAEGKF